MEQSYYTEPVKSFNVGLFLGVVLGGSFIAGIASVIPVIGFILGPVLSLGVLVFSLIMLYQIPIGLNQMCYGDGEHTMNWICAGLLSMITLGIYGVIYYYKMQKRMSENSKRYDAGVSESSPSTVLILMLCGYLTGVTAIIAFGMLISSYNRMVYAYNSYLPEPGPEPEPIPGPEPYRFNKSVSTTPPMQGKLRCLSGELEGASIILADGRDIVIGRQADKSNIVLSSSRVSRTHCSVSYDSATDQFYITDLSSNGTKLMNGSNLLKNVKTPIANNTEFELTDKSRFIVTSGPVVINRH